MEIHDIESLIDVYNSSIDEMMNKKMVVTNKILCNREAIDGMILSMNANFYGEGVVTPTTLRNRERYLVGLNDKIEGKIMDNDVLINEDKIILFEILALRKKVRALEIIKNKLEHEHRRKCDRKEQKEIDDLVAMSFIKFLEEG